MGDTRAAEPAEVRAKADDGGMSLVLFRIAELSHGSYYVCEQVRILATRVILTDTSVGSRRNLLCEHLQTITRRLYSLRIVHRI